MFSNSHNVEGVKYLRADYGIRCDTARWWGMAAYAGTWYLAYVMGFPLFVLYKLWSYRKSSADHQKEHVDLRFLLVDYKSFAPVLLWEGIRISAGVIIINSYAHVCEVIDTYM
jgi:hypothetical protein